MRTLTIYMLQCRFQREQIPFKDYLGKWVLNTVVKMHIGTPPAPYWSGCFFIPGSNSIPGCWDIPWAVPSSSSCAQVPVTLYVMYVRFLWATQILASEFDMALTLLLQAYGKWSSRKKILFFLSLCNTLFFTQINTFLKSYWSSSKNLKHILQKLNRSFLILKYSIYQTCICRADIAVF